MDRRIAMIAQNIELRSSKIYIGAAVGTVRVACVMIEITYRTVRIQKDACHYQ